MWRQTGQPTLDPTGYREITARAQVILSNAPNNVRYAATVAGAEADVAEWVDRNPGVLPFAA